MHFQEVDSAFLYKVVVVERGEDKVEVSAVNLGEIVEIMATLMKTVEVESGLEEVPVGLEVVVDLEAAVHLVVDHPVEVVVEEEEED